MRVADLTVLTTGAYTFTQDRRISSEYPHGGENSWGLIIKNVQHSDAGRYECQINTEPKMKRYVNLVVKGKQIKLFFYIGIIEFIKCTTNMLNNDIKEFILDIEVCVGVCVCVCNCAKRINLM